MKHISEIIEEILVEWAYRVHDGMPNPKNAQHIQELRESMEELNLPNKVIYEVIKNMINEDEEWWSKLSPEEQEAYIKKHPKSQKAQDAKKKQDKKEKPKKDSIDIKGELNNFEKYLSAEEKKAIELSDKARVKRLEQLDTLAESFKKLPSEVKNTSSNVFAKGQIYEGRPNSGIGKNRLGYLDVKNLSENKEYLLESYGDGSAKKVKEFVRNSRKIKVSEDYIRTSFDLLPKALQSALNGKGRVGDAGKNKHFLGYEKEDGSVTSDRNDPNIKKDENEKLIAKRGNPGNKERGRFVWRCILEQGGQDPYTGLPLDLNNIDLEHTVAFDNKDNGQPTEEDYLNREHDDNIIICATNVNQKKSNLSMKDFLERNVDTQKDKSEDKFKALGKAYEDVNVVSSQTKQKAALLLDDGYLREYDFDTLNDAFKYDDESYISAKEQFKKVAENKKDKQKISSLKSEIGKDTLMMMGMKRGLTDSSGRRTIKLSSDNLYRGFILSMAENPDKTEEYKEEWEKAREVGNSDKYRLTGEGQKGMIKYLINKNLISKKVLNDPKMGRVFNNALKEIYDGEEE
tara:strand:+ start:57 stop:1772 length:1716 start_codon:yes stop_codon:yes gene_type:complete